MHIIKYFLLSAALPFPLSLLEETVDLAANRFLLLLNIGSCAGLLQRGRVYQVSLMHVLGG